MVTWQKPELLYLLPTPYDHLLVEVDSVEGTEPPAETLAALKRVLEAYCSKPRGIRIVHGSPIPLSEAKGKPHWQIALEHLDGPPKEADDGRTAFLYVLFYDSSRLGRKSRSPHVGGLYPCAVYFDLAYRRSLMRHFGSQLMVHELGHILGLCKNRSHGDGAHCHNEYCAMGARALAPMRTWLFGISPPKLCDKYCEDCQRDIEEAKKLLADSRIGFRGPFYVRQEEGYYVATLPFLVKLSLRRLDALDSRKDLRKVQDICRKYGGKAAQMGGVLTICETPENELPDKATRLQRAAEDPSGTVRGTANTLLQKLGGAGALPQTTQPAE